MGQATAVETLMDMHRCAIGHIGARAPLLRMALHHHRNLRGEPMSFADMPFLVDFYRLLANVPELVVMKCTAVGFTEAALVFAAYQAGERGRRHTFVYPDDDIARGLVQERVQPLVDRVPYYREMANAPRPGKDPDNMRLRHFGQGSWRFLGSKNAAKFHEFQTDSVLVDEYDKCDQANLGLLEDRQRNSTAPQMFYFGNPRSSTGIVKLFERSDQRRWYQRCTRCNHRQRIDWFEHIVEQRDDGLWVPRDRQRAAALSPEVKDPPRHLDIRPVCSRCNRPWDRTADGSCWVVENPGQGVVGLNVAQYDHLDRRIWRLVQQWSSSQDDPTKLAIFYGSVLGIGYEPKDARFTVTDLRNCERSYDLDYVGGEEYRARTVVAGVDVGAILNVVIDSIEHRPHPIEGGEVPTRVARWVGACRTFEEVGDLLKRYHVDMCVVDAEPEHHKAQEFRDWSVRNTRTMVWLCRYHPTPRVGLLPYGMVMKGAERVVQVDKTAVMDATFAEYRQRLRWVPRDIRHVLHWVEHMRAPVRKPRPKGDGFFWDRGSRRDDYRQAECYSRIAWDLLGMAGGITTVSW